MAHRAPVCPRPIGRRREGASGRRLASSTGCQSLGFLGFLKQRNNRSLQVSQVAISFVLLLGLAAHIQTVESFYIDSRQSPEQHEWDYENQADWARRHRECSLRAQSPIDIQHKDVIVSQHLKLRFFNYNQQAESSLMAGGNRSSFLIRDSITGDEYVEFTQPLERPRTSNTTNQQLHHNQPAEEPSGQQQHSEKLRTAKASNGSAPEVESKSGKANGLGRTSKEYDSSMGSSHGQSVTGLGGGGKRLKQDELDRERVPLEHTRQHLGPKNNDLDEQQQLPYDGAPTIRLDWLDDGNNEFRLRDIHFHWGERRDNGSEHAIEGRRAAMEMHLVHVKHGLDESAIGFTSDSIAVIGVLIESHRKSNADFNPIVNQLVNINATQEAQEIDYKSIYDLLPSNLAAFYTYSGSLTTPPCYQVVNWIVLAERLNMNAKQIEMFRNLYAPPSAHNSPAENSHEEQPPPSQRATTNNNHRDRPAQLRGHQVHTATSSAASGEAPNNRHAHWSAGQSSGSGPANGEQDANGEGPSLDKLIVPNVRSIQPLNNRTILASFAKLGGNRFDSIWSSSGSSAIHWLRLVGGGGQAEGSPIGNPLVVSAAHWSLVMVAASSWSLFVLSRSHR